jgi:hypothetical protein
VRQRGPTGARADPTARGTAATRNAQYDAKLYNEQRAIGRDRKFLVFFRWPIMNAGRCVVGRGVSRRASFPLAKNGMDYFFCSICLILSICSLARCVIFSIASA